MTTSQPVQGFDSPVPSVPQQRRHRAEWPEAARPVGRDSASLTVLRWITYVLASLASLVVIAAAVLALQVYLEARSAFSELSGLGGLGASSSSEGVPSYLQGDAPLMARCADPAGWVPECATLGG